MISDFLEKLSRHAAVACGNFERIFQNTDSLTPLPGQTVQLVREVNREDADIDKIDNMLTATPEIAAHILRMVNSAALGVPREIKDVRHAITMLGMRRIRQLITSVSVMNALPQPSEQLFDRHTFWADSLLTALLAWTFSRRAFPGYEEEVFICSLLSEMAIPVLLVDWEAYYRPVLAEWEEDERRLSEIEQAHFGWDHGQAGSWLAEQWNLPKEMVSFIGVHSLSINSLERHELVETPAVVLCLAARFPSMLKKKDINLKPAASQTASMLPMSGAELAAGVTEIEEHYEAMREMLSLPEASVSHRLQALYDAFNEVSEEA